MHSFRAVSLSAVLVLKPKPLAGALAAALLTCSSAYAASFGHSRLVSAPGQAFHVNVPVTQLSADDLRSFSAAPAPAAAWREAGLVPPVDLATLQVHLADGYGPGSKLIQLRSSQAFNKPVADILLDVRTATGQQRYQVSLLTHAGLNTVAPAATDSRPSGSQSASQAVPAKTIRVKQGDVMFAIAKRHAVPGVSIYQMMIALQRANPQAFIHDNVNLVKAGATLTMPSHDALTAISKQEAYRIFQQQAQAYAQYRQRAAAHTSEVAQGSGAAGVVSAASSSAPAPSTEQARDQLRLSGGQAASDADDAVATSKGIADSQERVSQLEDNVKTLNKALQSQGLAASTLVIDSAKGLSDSIAQAGDTVGNNGDAATSGASQDTSGGHAQGQGGGNASPGAAQATAGAGQSGATSGNAAGGGNAQGDTSAATASSSTSAGDTTASTGGSASGSNAATGSATALATSNGNGASGGTAANSSTPGHTPGGNEGGKQVDASTNDAGGASAAAAGGHGGQQAASSDDGATRTAESISTKAEQSVSWFQEHMLGVIAGLLAFIVLVIAWLLRRANAARDVGREGNTGPITEAMVKEKLDQINFDFEQDTPSRSRSDSK